MLGIEAQTRKDLPSTIDRTVLPALRHLLGFGTRVCLRKGHLDVWLSSDGSVCTPGLCVLTVCKLHWSCKRKTCPSVWKQLEGKDSAWTAVTRWLSPHLSSRDMPCFTQGICSVVNCIISQAGEMTSFLESSKEWR